MKTSIEPAKPWVIARERTSSDGLKKAYVIGRANPDQSVSILLETAHLDPKEARRVALHICHTPVAASTCELAADAVKEAIEHLDEAGYTTRAHQLKATLALVEQSLLLAKGMSCDR